MALLVLDTSVVVGWFDRSDTLYERQRRSFEHTADAYDRYRPTYPKELFEDVRAYANLEPDDRILEIEPAFLDSWNAAQRAALAGLNAEYARVQNDRSSASFAKLRDAYLKAFPDLPENPDPKTVFLKLRELRNKW